jgi:hypothetical protein
MATTNGTTDAHRELLSRSVFNRSEIAVAHTVYGLILTLATLGELIHNDASSRASVAWLLGAGVVLLAAHLFSDLLAHIAATRDDPRLGEILSIGREDVTVVAGFIGAALLMAVAAVSDLDTGRALQTCVALGLTALAGLTVYATSHHRWWTRIVMGLLAVLLGAVIVVLENSV